MATIRSYTDLEQSKKLAKILPIESADMFYCYGMDIHTKKWEYDIVPTIIDVSNQIDIGDIPCWSLAALLDVLPYPEIWQDHSTNRWACSSIIKDTEYLLESENPVDSCVEVIIKLHKEGLL